ncbi:MAG: malic enzyme-like NAD(P)-binding protein [Dehalococcoidia bacterium]|nr:malic enzyme-like NAD(P)-binding protein [Dehalococcoidia bacterium]
MPHRMLAVEGRVHRTGYTLTVRASYPNRVGMLGRITSAIGEAGGDIGAVDIVQSTQNMMVRDITFTAHDVDHGYQIIERIKAVEGVHIRSISDPVFLLHLGGKIEIANKAPVKTRGDLSAAYTPGVARICQAIHKEPLAVWSLTIKGNSVAVVTDGSAVLGLGDIGPEAALPVMEGKAMLFKEFGGVDAWPICLATNDTDEIVRAVKAIAPGFGGINLEDIAAPRCFEIEERLRAELDIPVFHDDQHGTAVVVLAGLINALKIVKKKFEDLRVVLLGVGAAGVACTRILQSMGVRDIVGVDRAGTLYKGRKEHMNEAKVWYAENTNPRRVKGSLSDAMEGADVFVGLSGPGLLTVDDIRKMNRDPIVFAMANPDPEIPPEEALPYVRVFATGRSDYPNQINNVLCFPGFFRGLLDTHASAVNEEMKIAAAQAIASTVSDRELHEEYIIPSVFNRSVARAVARAVADAAYRTGAAVRHRRSQQVHLWPAV